jgi:hypothetical protein
MSYYHWLGAESDDPQARAELMEIHRAETQQIGWLRATARMGERARLWGLNIETSDEEARKLGWMV